MKTCIILIDFENVQPGNLARLHGRDFKIKVFLGPNQTKSKIDQLVQRGALAISNGKVTYPSA